MNQKGEIEKLHKINFDISFFTLLKIIFTAAVIIFIARVFQLGLLLFLGLLLAVSLDPLVQIFRKRGASKGFAITVIALSMTALIGLVGLFLVPSIFNQIINLIKNVPTLKEKILANIAQDNFFYHITEEMLQNPKIPATDVLINQAWSVVNIVLGGLTEFFLILIFSIYLLVDGRRSFKWICDFFSAPTRSRLQATAEETSRVVFGYVTTQIVTCTMSGIYSYAILTLLHVPGALTLAALAGILDIIPILGFFLAVIPAMLLSFTISPYMGIYVFALYLFYHGIENYFITPIIYGRRLKVSSIVVLLALLFAGALGGILGALAILPVVASYPIIERIWLVKYLGRHVPQKHSEKTEMSDLSEQVKVWNKQLFKTGSLELTTVEPSLSHVLRKTVLIVEDDDDIRSALKEILEMEGYEVLIATHGKDGLAILNERQDIGLILLDMAMPVMDGQTFLSRMKAEERFNKIPVVYLSGQVTEHNSGGAAGYLKKPAELKSVLDLVSKHYTNSPSLGI